MNFVCTSTTAARSCCAAIGLRARVCPRQYSWALKWSSTGSRQWSTPLAKSLAEAITTTGPISIANYMRQCLTSPEWGYYTAKSSQGKDQFGREGDFVTSPEISQVFGELVGIWFVAEWMAQGGPRHGVELIELGPGRGTLMSDVTIKNFKAMASSIETIYLVEASASLRRTQKELLCGSAPLEDHPAGNRSMSKQISGVDVVWIEHINFKPRDPGRIPFIIAHEFFDALPIYAFQSVPQPASSPPSSIIRSTSETPTHKTQVKSKNEWRELLVSPTPPPSVINPPKSPGPEFELTLSSAATHYSRLLPTLSPRYSALLPNAGSTIEICPEAQTTIASLSELIGGSAAKISSNPRAPHAQGKFQSEKASPSGAALIIDYGSDSSIPIATLRGIRSHKRCSPFTSPGQVDLSADVDFGALVEAALSANERIEVHGPVTQADWLESMGGKERCDALVRTARANPTGDKDSGGDELVEAVVTGWKRLVDRGVNGMGKLYKVMAIVPDTNGRRRPVGFGGDVDADI